MDARTDDRVAAGAPLDSDVDPSEIPLTAEPDRGGLLAELRWRGMLQDATPGLDRRLANGIPLSAYNGFDPTAISLHVGHLVPVFGLLHLQRHGNRPVVVVGGGTGMIGDPSGRSAERTLQTRETIVGNVAALRVQLERFLDFQQGPTGALMVDNFDWLGPWSLLDFLRDIGKHFTVPYMLAKDSVQIRLQGGLSFTEFSYMLLQAADFLHLYREFGVEAQLGGADQWGNITAGLELIRRVEGGDAFGMSFPLHMNASGEKFGKSNAGGNVWLDPTQTSPFDFYQHWFGAADTDVGALLRKFTLLDQPTIERIEAAHGAAPERRLAQRMLARDMTTRVHGTDGAERAELESNVRFGSSIADAGIVDAVVEAADLVSAVEFVTKIGAASSRSEARRLISQGGFTVNDARITDPNAGVPAPGDGRLRVRVGKRRVLIVHVRAA